MLEPCAGLAQLVLALASAALLVLVAMPPPQYSWACLAGSALLCVHAAGYAGLVWPRLYRAKLASRSRVLLAHARKQD